MRGVSSSAARRSPPFEVIVRRATVADLAAIAALGVWVVAPERQREIVRDGVAAGGVFVATPGSDVAGFVTWDRGFFNRPFVRLLAVSGAHRRRGVAGALLARVEREAAPYGELFVSTEEINAPMRALLVAAGYGPSGSIENVNPPGNAELVYYKRLC